MAGLLSSTRPAHVEPAGVIGLGAWGQAVIADLRTALEERAPVLAEVCPMLGVDRDEPDASAQIKELLRETRRAERLRLLEREGLAQLDPEIAPTTYLYLVAALDEDTELQLSRAVAELAQQAAGQLHASVAIRALIRLGEEHRLPALQRLALTPCRFSLFATEPVTSQGLILTENEFRSGIVEVLFAALQPGGSDLLANGRGQIGTVGVSWLTWNPAALRSLGAEVLAAGALRVWTERLAAKGSHARSDPEALAGERLRQFLNGIPVGAMRTNGTWRLDVRVPAALSAVDAQVAIRTGRRLLQVLPRRLARWNGQIVANRLALAEQEPHPDPAPLPTWQMPVATADPAQQLSLVERLLRLPPFSVAAIAIGVALTLGIMFWWAAHGSALALGTWTLCCLLALAAYGVGRPHLIGWLLDRFIASVSEQIASSTRLALEQEWASLNAALLAQQDEARSKWRNYHLSPPVVLGRAEPPPGVLHRHLIDRQGLERVKEQATDLLPAFLDQLPMGEPSPMPTAPAQVAAQLRAEAEQFLSRQPGRDALQLTVEAYGEQLAAHLSRAVRDLFTWSKPLMARHVSQLEIHRWLFWPIGLPCPPVPPDVQTHPAIGGAALITVVHDVSAR